MDRPRPEAHLQGGAVFRERGAEEGVDGVKHHVDDVLLQDRITETLLSVTTNLQKRKRHQQREGPDLLNW